VELHWLAADRPAALNRHAAATRRRAWDRAGAGVPLDEHELLGELAPSAETDDTEAGPSLRPSAGPLSARNPLPFRLRERAAQGEGLGSLLLINHTSRRVASTTSGSDRAPFRARTAVRGKEVSALFADG